MNSSNKVQPGVRINSSVWKEFRQDIQGRKGSVRGHLKSELENALEAYIDGSHGGDTNDRLRRLESQLEDVHEEVCGDEHECRKKKKDSDVGTKTERRLDEIQNVIQRETGNSVKVHEAVVRQAIEEVAGHSEPTIRRYKQMLVDREMLFPTPRSESKSFFRDATEFAKVVNQFAENSVISQEKYNDILNDYGPDWWQEQLPSDSDDKERGFQ